MDIIIFFLSFNLIYRMYGIAAQVMIKPLMNIFLSRSHVYFEKKKKTVSGIVF